MDNQVEDLLEEVISYRQTVPKCCDELTRQDTAALMRVLRNIKIDLTVKVPRIQDNNESKSSQNQMEIDG